jgi:hypothetical protein
MAKERKPVDITHTPDVLRLAEEVARSGIPRVLQRDQRDVAVISPAPSSARRVRRSKPTSDADPLLSIVGLASAADFPDVSQDVSRQKHAYLAEAYQT